VEIAMAALVLAVATGIGVGLMVESFRADFTRVLDQRLSHDMFVDLEGIDATALATSIAARFPAARIQAGGRGRIDIDGRPVELVHARFDAAEAARYGHVARLEPFEAMANERFARLYDLWAGASVALPNATVRIVHVYAGYGDAQPRLLVDDSTAQAVLGQLVRDRLSITAADTEALASFVHGEAMNANVERRAEVRATALAVFDRTFAITGALTLLATLVAFAGMYTALSAMRLGQRASRARLDALGVSALERLAIDLTRSVAIAIPVIIIALPVGIAIGWLLCHVVNPRAFGWTVRFDLPAAALWSPVAAGIAAAVAACLLPAPRERIGGD
jgi:putative ABC transport system permease protein